MRTHRPLLRWECGAAGGEALSPVEVEISPRINPRR